MKVSIRNCIMLLNLNCFSALEMSIDGDRRPLDLDSSVIIPFTTVIKTTPSECPNMKRQPQVDREPSIVQSSPSSTWPIQHHDGRIRIAGGSEDEENMMELPLVYDPRL